MNDEPPILTAEEVRQEAFNLLRAIQASRGTQIESQWRKLWQLVLEAKAARVPWGDSSGPWHLVGDGDHDGGESVLRLVAGGYVVPLWPPSGFRYAADLPSILNWAGVPRPDWSTNMDERNVEKGERAREAAERRRDEAELYRRKAEEGRTIHEALRGRGEQFRDHGEGARTTTEQTRVSAELVRDGQEGGREVAEQARDIAETFRSAAEEARAAAADARRSLGEFKELLQRQRLIVDRQEQALTAMEQRFGQQT